ncbi:hypothetical protein RUM43_012029, partial [Polyplax serrata]
DPSFNRTLMTLSIGLLLTAIAVRILLPPWPGPVDASESPERECCDPIYPLLTPTATTILNPTSLATTSPGFPGKIKLTFHPNGTYSTI